MEDEMKKFDKIYRIQRLELIKLFLHFWGGFFLVFFFSILFYLISLFDTSNQNLYYFCGSIVLILLTSFIEYPLVSRDVHIKFKKISLLLVIIFVSINYFLLFNYNLLIDTYNLGSNLIPFFSLFLIPSINELLKKLIEFNPSDVKIKFHDKSKMASMDTGIKEWYWHDLSDEIKQKGLPIFIINNNNTPIIISNLRLEILNSPVLVPKLAVRRICKLKKEKYSNIYIFHEFKMNEILTIQPKQGKLFIISKEELDAFYKKIKKKGEIYSRIIQPMYVTAIDSFNVKEYPSEKVYYPTVNIFFMF